MHRAPQSSHVVNVLLTVDTEVWPRLPDWRETRLAGDIRRDILGVTPEGDFGVPFQMEVLNAHGLKAVFFVESLFACAVGLEPLAGIVDLIERRGHEVQVHAHSEWLAWMPEPILGDRRGQNLKDFTESEQEALLARAILNLKHAGARNLCAFRAGNYGANFDTLRVLARQGIAYDSSHNTCYLDSTCGMRTPELLLQPRRLHGVYEFPVSFFGDWPGHRRHAQLCACSAAELEAALLNAWRRGWYSFVVVSHGFEMVKGRKQIQNPIRPDHIVINRWERLCRFLAQHRDKFRTAVFSEIDPQSIPVTDRQECLRSATHRTLWRLVEQAAGRLL